MTLTISFLSLAAFVWFSSPILFSFAKRAFTRLNSIGKSFGENCRDWTCEWVNNKNTWLYIMILKGNTSTQYQFNSFPLRKLSFTLGDVTLRVIEDITWLRGDTKFLFECWKIFHEWAQRTVLTLNRSTLLGCFRHFTNNQFFEKLTNSGLYLNPGSSFFFKSLFPIIFSILWGWVWFVELCRLRIVLSASA